jgi:hypothetical protein
LHKSSSTTKDFTGLFPQQVPEIWSHHGLLRKKKAYVRLTQDYDALDVANRIGRWDINWETSTECCSSF